ncbi:recombination factor protein RarA [Pokkaliibacter plantistimulans]|uniref:Replication-associated recombination protein A n=1 Tax=Proteobacteria bacterium 228 TaxID=2083153 RepID=A0A2S5KQP3_9PROT|nr:replication-associated recombination protein A [Pokkaliibacter plantistimulans]PPC77050.1 recombination factor protein RarA [Pokkaliibacter plantistimulans]
MSGDLFSQDEPQGWQPLASRMRPNRLADYVGQQHLLGEGKPLRMALDQGRLHSMILWGPPGVGKTTLAKLVAENASAHFVTLSAVLAGVKDIRDVVEMARQRQMQSGKKTLLFVDEVHRFNKSQQDAFLPHVEEGLLIFVGATTENPSFALNNALLSRARVYLLKSLTEDDLVLMLHQALTQAKGLADLQLQLSDQQLCKIAKAADGDGRTVLNLLELVSDIAELRADGSRVVDEIALAEVLMQGGRRFDRQGDMFYDQISAFHKSVRGSSPDGALYWFARMLDGGCDPLYVARRLLAIASEDIGNADPRALQITLNAWDIFERVGPAEGERAIAQAAVYCACAPKSNAVYSAWKAAQQIVRETGSLEVPHHLRNAPTGLMQSLGYGAEYRYAHDEPDAYAAGEHYLPEEIFNQRFYQPTERGLERKIGEKLSYLRQLDELSDLKRYEEN